jgi:RNA polymerase sigma-70 factor (ECF subfamily)
VKKQFTTKLNSELLKRIKKDRRAQTEVYSTYYKRVYSSCLRILNDPHEAEDLMQEAFMHAFKKIESFRGDANLGTWICRIAINKCLDHLKKRRVDLELDDNWERRDAGEYEIEESDNPDLDKVYEAMKTLPEGCRIVFSLHLLEEMDHETIDYRLGIKEASSRAQYARARNKIRSLLNQSHV